MLDWFKAIFLDGGLGHLGMVLAFTCGALWLHSVWREWSPWWESGLVMVAVLLLFAWSPVWDMVSPPAQDWQRLPDLVASTLTPAKRLWLDLVGVLAGRVAVAVVPAALMRMLS
jgi:hypothetical protein